MVADDSGLWVLTVSENSRVRLALDGIPGGFAGGHAPSSIAAVPRDRTVAVVTGRIRPNGEPAGHFTRWRVLLLGRLTGALDPVAWRDEYYLNVLRIDSGQRWQSALRGKVRYVALSDDAELVAAWYQTRYGGRQVVDMWRVPEGRDVQRLVPARD